MVTASCELYYARVYSPPPDMAGDIAENLKRLRGDMSQEQLAERSGIPQSSVSKYENGTVPALKTALRLAVGLGVGLDEIADGLDADYSSQQRARSVSATGALLQGSASTEPEQALKKGSPGSGKTLAPHQENATESASSTPAQVGEGRAQGGSDDAHGTEEQSAPTPRREPVATNAEIAAQLSKYAGWLAQSGEIQAALVAAAMALVRPEGGANRDTGTGPDPRSGSGGRRNPRRGRR